MKRKLEETMGPASYRQLFAARLLVNPQTLSKKTQRISGRPDFTEEVQSHLAVRIELKTLLKDSLVA